jgi:ParB family chromosome partitioning protein
MEQYQVLPIGKVFESPLNPRKTFNEKKMAELVESIRAKGILVPLLVRPCKESRIAPLDQFEIAAGHRRYRAGIKAELTEVPVFIREMSDSDFLEVLIIENDKHEDLEPLEQAQGYRTLMEQMHYDVAAISDKVCKSESWIYQRIKLLELIPEAQEQLANEKITAGHAILIARLQPDQQKELLKKESGLYEGWGNDRTVVSVRDLANHIERQIHLDLNSASFKKTDPDLVPEAGPCTTCQKRTGFVPALFPEIKKKDTCTDPSCFNKKVAAFSARWLSKQSEDSDVPPLHLSGSSNYRMKKAPEDPEVPVPANLYHVITDKKKGSCPSAREGIITEGSHEGRILTVCTDPACKVHHGRSDSYSSSPEGQKYKAQQKAAEEKRKTEETVRLRIIDAILPDTGDLSQADLIFLAEQLFDELWDEHRKKILSRHEIEPVKIQYGFDKEGPMKKYIATLNKPNLNRLLMEMGLIRHRENPRRLMGKRGDPILETAARYGVDHKKIEAQVKAEAKAKEAEKKSKKQKAPVTKSPSLKQKPKRKDPPDVKTIPMKDICKLHAPAKPVGGKGKEMRVPADQVFLAMVEKTYSGDLLTNGGNKIREPVEWQGDFYVSLGGASSGTEGFIQEEAWKVVSANLFEGKTYSYDELIAKWDQNEKERGNHHGQRVLLKGKSYVLEGPKVIFFAEKVQKKPKAGVCRVCGCTEKTPCIDPTFLTPCAWADKEKTLCTACQNKSKEHQWEKQNLVTVASTRNVPMHDIYKCKTCGATAKRFGISEFIRRDKKFATWEQCPGPKKEVQTTAKGK